MPNAFTDREKELIREKLLEQGYKLFSTYGLRKTNIEEITEAAGISKGAFYNFYESKEELFLDAAELAEKRFRQEIIAVVDLPGPSPRARLFAVLKRAVTLVKTIPLMQFFSSRDFNLLFRKVPAEKVHAHLHNDQMFIADLVARCQKAGIPIQVQPQQISGLLLSLFFNILHEDDLGPEGFPGTIDILLELVAAFCLGEIVLRAQNLTAPITPLD